MKKELRAGMGPSPSTFLTIFILGISSTWHDKFSANFGCEHLKGARVLVDSLLEDHAGPTPTIDSQSLHLIVGSYIYWDMACSFLAAPDELKSLSSPPLRNFIQSTRNSFRAIIGFSLELFFHLANLGRYCRQVIGDSNGHHWVTEVMFEQYLLQWEPPQGDYIDRQMCLYGDSFRIHGLIMLYRICGCPFTGNENINHKDIQTETEQLIQQLALNFMGNLSKTPLTCSYFNLYNIPLFTAGSELLSSDSAERVEVLRRLRSLYSMNRCPVNL